MRLLMISGDRSVPSGKQGAFHATLEEFSKQWERIDVICPNVQTPRPSPFATVSFHPSPRGLLWQPKWILEKGTELLGQYHHDVMTVHEYPPFYNGIGAARLHRRAAVPYVLEIHHIVGYPRAANAAEWTGGILSRAYLARDARQAAAVRVVNGDVAARLQRFGVPARKIRVVPSVYLDASIFRPDPGAIKRYDIVFCARLVANKGLLPLLEALRLSPFTLLIIGDGPQRKRAEAFVRHHRLGARVTFAGWLPTQGDVADALRSAHVFVMNSFSEGGPRSAVEAMACGLPAISTRVGVMPDVVRESENGQFTDGTAADLAAALSSLLSDRAAAARMGERAAEIAGRFERKALIAQYADFLKEFARARA